MPNASQAQFPYHQRPSACKSKGRGDARERIRHSDLRRGGVQHKRVLFVQSRPARQNLLARQGFFPRDLISCRRTTEFDEQAVCPSPQLKVAVIHACQALTADDNCPAQLSLAGRARENG
jgi:hypothetical protein